MYDEWDADDQLNFIRAKVESWSEEMELNDDSETLEQITTMIELIAPMTVEERFFFFENFLHGPEEVSLPEILEKGPTPNQVNDVMYQGYWANSILAWEIPYREKEQKIGGYLQNQNPDWSDGGNWSTFFTHDGEEYWEPTIEKMEQLNEVFSEIKCQICMICWMGGRNVDEMEVILPPSWYIDIAIYGGRTDDKVQQILDLARGLGYPLSRQYLYRPIND